jgi:mono/diheme cytochrome c family protein
MKPEERRQYLEEYQEDKKKGIPFFPNALFKDAVVSLIVLIALIALSWFVGSELGERADPSDDSFSPKPEWYFLFLFQLLKYFPGDLEFLGVVVIPAVVILALFALPWLDRSAKRHITGRPFVFGIGGALIIGILFLSIQSVVEQPPPAQAITGDPVAALYVENCSGCHGTTIDVPPGTELTEVIAQGGHAGMPAWNADLSADEIDALAGFILSPNGSVTFRSSCSECHQASDLSGINPVTLRSALDEGFESHAGLEIAPLERTEASALVNFLIAPDGHRLFSLNCSSCHGNSVALAGTREDLRHTIETGGGHLDMPAMGGILTDAEIDALAAYVVEPGGADAATLALFEANCATCHGSLVPTASDVETARTVIAVGGAHEDMPVWGTILTTEQIDALTEYAYEAAQGSPAVVGQQLYADNCASCHGDFGEGGANPVNPVQIISPISTAGYLATRDDTTLRAIINQGQPDLGMSPFGLAYGGPLDEEEVGAIVAFIRAWQANPPVELPPEVERAPLLGDAAEIYGEFCSQCHGDRGEGGIGPEFQSDEFHATKTDEQLYTIIDLGHPATAMIAWGEVLTAEQIETLVEYIRSLRDGGDEPPPTDEVSFSRDVMPLFQQYCLACHGSSGGWSAADYRSVMESGDNAPVVIPGDAAGSVLGQSLLGEGRALMPPQGMPDEAVQIILAWITAGAPDN